MKKLGYVTEASGIVSAICIAGIFLLMCAEVFSRNLFHHPILGSTEICTYLYVAAAYFGISYTQKCKGHIAVELLYDRLKPRGKWVFDTITYCVGAVIFLFLSLFTWKAFLDSAAIKETYLAAMKMPVYLLKCAIALGVTLMLLQLVLDAIHHFSSAKDGTDREVAQ